MKRCFPARFSVITATLVIFGCENINRPVEVAPPVTHHTVTTGTDGISSFPEQNLQVAVADLVSERSLPGINVTLLNEGTAQGLVIVDPTERYAPIAMMLGDLSPVQGGSMGLSTEAAPYTKYRVHLVPRDFLGEVVYAIPRLTAGMWQYLTSKYYKCREGRLENTFHLILTALAEAGFVEGMTGVIAGVAALIPGGQLVAGPIAAIGWVMRVGSLTTTFWNMRVLDQYLAQGYTIDQRFRICTVRSPFHLVFPHIKMEPLEAPRIPPPGRGTLSGTVRDATTGSPVRDAKVGLMGPSPSSLIAFDGTFQFSQILSGLYSLTASKPGFIPSTVSINVEPGANLTQDIAISPRVAAGNVRIVLTWGLTPRDLDSHLFTPSIEGRTYHIYFGSKGSTRTAPYAELDVDDTNSFGPETITIARFFPGTYAYAVHDYTNRSNPSSNQLVQSGATVEVYSAERLMGRFRIADVTNPGPGTWWNLFTIDGTRGDLTLINRLSSEPPRSMLTHGVPEPVVLEKEKK